MIENHSLANEFPEYKQQIHQLKTHDNHFRRLFEDYNNVEHEVHRIETGAENTSDDYLEELKKKRLHLKDTLCAMLKSEAAKA